MLITNAEVDGIPSRDLRIEGNQIQEIGSGIQRQPGEIRMDAEGGALIPGLHDHHIHLYALAAARASLACGPPQVRTAQDLEQALRGACRKSAPGNWIRGTGYHESVAGDLDRHALDGWTEDRPVRIQHRSGALWILNTAAMKTVGAFHDAHQPGIECDASGEPNGRLFRLDAWLRERLDDSVTPGLAEVSLELARYGVTGVTDATPTNDAVTWNAFGEAEDKRELLQRLWVMGRMALPEKDREGIRRASLKIMLDDARLPEFDELAEQIREAHRARRHVAIHCVTRGELVFATEALAEAGSQPGDRIEHAAVTPPELMRRLGELSLTVVTQHSFLRDRGDNYARDVDPRDQPWLYRGRGFLDANVPLGGGTDAPFGSADPWHCIQAAVQRRTEGGQAMNSEETLSPEAALALFTTPPERPGGSARRVTVGQPADLCLLDRPWAAARSHLSSDMVRSTFCEGRTLWQRA